MVSVPKNEKTMIQCICNACPSYNECMRGEVLGVFCSLGDAGSCVQNIETCNCQECSISSEFNFSSEKHCEIGSAESQANK
jgi:hypothetical protein